MSAIAIIPARGGSKRIPRKNIKQFHGRPMISWTIGHAIESKLFEEIIVSTDDPEIASIAKEYGAIIGDFRPHYLSDDNATLIAVMNYEAKKLIERQRNPSDTLCCLYPASPLLKFEAVKRGLKIVNDKNADYAISVKEFEQSPLRAFEKDESGFVKYKFPENSNFRSQDLRTLYADAGQFTIANIETWARNKSSLNGSIYPIILGKYEAIDLDDINDWQMAEEIFELRSKNI
jgi:N-acylneuraminate cytidylyltransferase